MLYARTQSNPASPIAVRALATALVGLGLLTTAQALNPGDEEVPEGLTVTEWSSIRAAYEANRYAAFPVEGEYGARNPGQQWSTRFDGRGFTTTPDARSWSWGLELVHWGFEGHEREIAGTAEVDTDGQRVTYDWDGALQEWYVNDGRGLEHGYTVRQRPTCAREGPGPLTFMLEIRGGLSPEVSNDGRGVRFLDESGATLLDYTGLTVFDADGRPLPAGFERSADELCLTIDEDGARYPLTIDPIAQQAYLKASNTDAFDYFGGSVSVSGDTVVVGALRESSDATGVDGDENNNSAPEAGAAYVFVRNGTVWGQQAYLKASNTEGADCFGRSVSVSGDTVVVGADAEESNATGVNGDQSDNSAVYAGAAYVFVRNGTVWSHQAYLKASNTEAYDIFGHSVSVSGDTVVVGAEHESSNATGVNGDQNNNSAGAAGAAYVFVRNGTVWSQQAYLKASNTDPNDNLGHEVSVSDDTVVVGAWAEDSNATGVNGDQSNNGAIDAGAAYVFVRNGTVWSQQAYLKASNTDAGDGFGFPTSVSGDTLVVGAPGESSIATGVNGDQSDNSAHFPGAAYVFVRNGTVWSQQAYLKASNTDTGDEFGRSASVSGDTLVVGAPLESSIAIGVNGDESDNGAASAGAAYVFVRNGTVWSPPDYIKASNTDADDRFGHSVSVSGCTVVVGAWFEASDATGVNNGDQGNNSADAAGAAYVFDLCAPAVVYCTAGSTINGCSAVISATGTASASSASTFNINITGADGQRNGLIFYGLTGRSATTWGMGAMASSSWLCVKAPIQRTSPGTTGGTLGLCDGAFSLEFNARIQSGIDPNLFPGAVVNAQFWFRDPPSPNTTHLSNGLEFVILP